MLRPVQSTSNYRPNFGMALDEDVQKALLHAAHNVLSQTELINAKNLIKRAALNERFHVIETGRYRVRGMCVEDACTGDEFSFTVPGYDSIDTIKTIHELAEKAEQLLKEKGRYSEEELIDARRFLEEKGNDWKEKLQEEKFIRIMKSQDMDWDDFLPGLTGTDKPIRTALVRLVFDTMTGSVSEWLSLYYKIFFKKEFREGAGYYVKRIERLMEELRKDKK